MTRTTARRKAARLLGVEVKRISTARNRTPYTGCELLLSVDYWPMPELIGQGATWAEAFGDLEARKAQGLVVLA